MTRLTIRMFGPLEVALDGASPPVQLSTQKTRSLLAYLLLHREAPQPREKLADLWWGNCDPAKARHCLSTAVWRLRQALGEPRPGQPPLLILEDDRIGLNPGAEPWLDVAEFEKACALARRLESRDSAAAAEALERAVELYRADLLPDCYEDWCLVERQRLQQLHLFALSRLAAYHARRGDLDDGIACCQRILAVEPLREEVHRDLIGLHLAASRPQEALRQYDACASLLRRELGLEPMPETAALLDRLPASSRTATPRPAPPAAHAGQDVRDVLAQLAVAAETVALMGQQVRLALQRAEQLLARPLADG